MLRFCNVILVLVLSLAANLTGCENTRQARGPQESVPGVVAGSGVSSQAGMPSVAEAVPLSDTSTPGGSAQAGQKPMDLPNNSAAMDSPGRSTPMDTSPAPDGSMPSAMDAGQRDSDAGRPRDVVNDLSAKALAMWGSSVCDGFSVPSGTGWPWTVEKKLAEIHGPKVLHVSTSGHVTDSKESSVERNKVKSADFVVVCLSLGNQGLGNTATEQSAQAVVAANILQQGYGIATVNHLGSTNAGNSFGEGDCTWANGRNAPMNVQSDARHPTRLGHDENFYAFPPDLPFAFASEIAFPQRPQTTDYISISSDIGTGQAGELCSEPIRYTPEHAMHNYTMQFAFQTSSDGTLATVDLGMAGFLTIEVNDGAIRLVVDGGTDALHSSEQVTNSRWHDVAITYSYVRQKLALYLDGALVGEHDAREGNNVRELFPQAFILGGPATSGRPAAPLVLQLRDLFINRTSLHAAEVKERATTTWVGAGSLDVYAPLRATAPAENRAQTLQKIEIRL